MVQKAGRLRWIRPRGGICKRNFRRKFRFNFRCKLRRTYARIDFGRERSGEPGEKKEQEDQRAERRREKLGSTGGLRFRAANLVQSAEGAFSTNSHIRGLRQKINRVLKHECLRVSLEDLVRNGNDAIRVCLRDISPRLSKRMDRKEVPQGTDSVLSSFA